MRRVVGFFLGCALAGCATGRPAPAPPSVQRVALLAPVNRTPDALLVTGTSRLERHALHTERVTVSDVLAAELAFGLRDRGIDATLADDPEHGHPADVDAAVQRAQRLALHDPVLFVTIDRWEPDAGTHPAFVVVALDATLVDPSTRAVLWHVHRRAAPIATPGAVTLARAYEVAAHQSAIELLRSWERPDAP